MGGNPAILKSPRCAIAAANGGRIGLEVFHMLIFQDVEYNRKVSVGSNADAAAVVGGWPTIDVR